MPRFQNLLVYVDTSRDRDEAVHQAADLARVNGASLRLIDVLAAPSPIERAITLTKSFGGARWTDLVAEGARKRLDELAEPLRAEGLEVSVDVLIGSPFLEIVREVLRHGHDLVLKTAEASGSGALFGTTALHLLRKCPCPVWLVDPRRERGERRVLAAVDPVASGPEALALARQIVEIAVDLAGDSGRLYVVHAFYPFGEQLLRHRVPEEELSAYVSDVRQNASEALVELLTEVSTQIPGGHVLLRQGAPRDVIVRSVEDLGIDHLVMGTVGRSGISGFLIGNTAEQVLTTVRCSVVAIKPEGFETPIRLEEAVAGEGTTDG